jgi:protein-L-isoaspartate(D-aspartate) O-methyltransferase
VSGASQLRDTLVDELVAAGHIRGAPLAGAFRAVPRHVFVPHVDLAMAYQDRAIVTTRDSAGRPLSSSSQPAMMAIMLEQLGLESGHRVLEIGTGTGYNAALMAHVVGDTGRVVSLDIDQNLALSARDHLEQAGYPSVEVVHADGADGWPSRAPYDRIIVTASASDLAPAWLAQLAGTGRVVVPLSLRGLQRSVAFEWTGDQLRRLSAANCGFMPLRGSLGRTGSQRPSDT